MNKVVCAGNETTSPLPVTFCALYSLPGLRRVHRLSTVVTMSSAVTWHHTLRRPLLHRCHVEERLAGLSATVTGA